MLTILTGVSTTGLSWWVVEKKSVVSSKTSLLKSVLVEISAGGLRFVVLVRARAPSADWPLRPTVVASETGP